MKRNYFYIQRVCLLIFLLVSQQVFSQKNYVQGYIIKNNSDTVSGFIDYKNWGKNPDKINFKRTINGFLESVYPSDILEFGVQNEVYVSGIIETEVTSIVQIDQFSTESKMEKKIDTAFLQVLVRGEKSLFLYNNSDGRKNYYIEKPEGFELLFYKKHIVKKYHEITQEYGERAITENNRYLGQLSIYLSDCEQISNTLANTSYNENSLIKLYEEYYKCSSLSSSFQKKKEKLIPEIGVLAGISRTSLEINHLYPSIEENNVSMDFSSGIFLDLILPRNHGKLSLTNEVIFTTYTVSGSYRDFTNENNYRIISTEIGLSYIKINNMFRLKYPIGKFFLFLNGGISNGFLVKERNYEKIESKFFFVDKTTEGKAFDEVNKYENEWIFGTGLRYNNVSFEARYEFANGMSEIPIMSSKIKRTYLLIGYRF